MAIKNLTSAAKGPRFHKVTEVPAPEFGEGETILVRKMTAGDTALFFDSMIKYRQANQIEEINGDDVVAIRLACCMVDEDGNHIMDAVDGADLYTSKYDMDTDTLSKLISTMLELSPPRSGDDATSKKKA